MAAVEPPTSSQAPSPDALVHAGFGPGRPLIFRQTIVTCHSPAAIADLSIGVRPTWTPAGGGAVIQEKDQGGTVAMLLGRSPLQIARASAIATYAEALASLRPALFPGVLTYVDQAVQAGADLDKDTDLKEIHDLAIACEAIAAAKPSGN
jgi:hypothetical protein